MFCESDTKIFYFIFYFFTSAYFEGNNTTITRTFRLHSISFESKYIILLLNSTKGALWIMQERRKMWVIQNWTINCSLLEHSIKYVLMNIVNVQLTKFSCFTFLLILKIWNMCSFPYPFFLYAIHNLLTEQSLGDNHVDYTINYRNASELCVQYMIVKIWSILKPGKLAVFAW